MSIHIRCGGCANEFDVPDSFAGKQGKCPHCGKVMTAPEARPAPAPAALARAIARCFPLPPPPLRARASRRSSCRGPKRSAIRHRATRYQPSVSPPLSAPSAEPGRQTASARGNAHLGLGRRGRRGRGRDRRDRHRHLVGVAAPVVATPGPNKPGTGSPTWRRSPGPGGTRKPLSPLDVPKETEWNKVKTAQALPECTAAMVKIMFPTGGRSGARVGLSDR